MVPVDPAYLVFQSLEGTACYGYFSFLNVALGEMSGAVGASKEFYQVDIVPETMGVHFSAGAYQSRQAGVRFRAR